VLFFCEIRQSCLDDMVMNNNISQVIGENIAKSNYVDLDKDEKILGSTNCKFEDDEIDFHLPLCEGRQFNFN